MVSAHIRSWIGPLERADAAIPGWLPETIPGTVRGPGTHLVFIAGLVAGAQAVFPNAGSLSPTLAGVAALYTLSLAAALLVRLSPDRRFVLLGTGLALVLAGALGFTTAGILGTLALDILAAVLAYHLPARWALPLLGAVAAVFVVVHTGQTPRVPGAHQDVPRDAVILAVLVTLALTLRSRSITIVRLHEALARLEAAMERTARLAAGRERTRIARDMHDVLAHSLTMVSMQTQAIRQIIARDPAQAARLLDELAEVVRECIAESRRVVGTLHAAAEVAPDESPLCERLRALAERFAQRTGLRCVLEERGAARRLGTDQEEALRYALQEALTNAFRHGAARQLRAEVLWEPAAVTLCARDDVAAPVGARRGPAPPTLPSGGQGLRGMGERAAALGGALRAGPEEGGGFVVEISLPLAGDATRPLVET